MKQVAIVGRPNVGKSALFNRIAQKRIAIVHDQPGITRDRISAEAEAGGKKFALWDTGGIVGKGETELTDDVRRAAERAMEEGDLILFVVDAQQGLTPVDRELAQFLRRTRKPVLLVVNKVDDPKHEPNAAEFSELGFEEIFDVSAAHGRNVPALLTRVATMLPAHAEGDREPTSDDAIRLAIVGRPNAGKSSLVNALLHDHRTIVSDTPGTTRDAVDIAYERAGKRYVLIDTAGIRARSKHSTSVEVFSVMRAEKTIVRADLCVLVIDSVEGVKAQDRRVAGLIQKERKPCVIVMNKWDLARPVRGQREAMAALIATTRAELFFLPYAPILVTSALTGEHADRIFKLIERVRRAADAHIGTGKLNRLLHAAFASNPPPTVANKRLKLFYATQAASNERKSIAPPEIVLFVNSPKLLTEPFARFLEGRIREVEPYEGLPVRLTLRARTETAK
ncbi:MAG: ribosome biogenesis GTPase Der [Verrucomicrobiota bacterium]|nr:ribosome biogenesis GTPase Der [Verrucomicrobiota bacterium]